MKLEMYGEETIKELGYLHGLLQLHTGKHKFSDNLTVELELEGRLLWVGATADIEVYPLTSDSSSEITYEVCSEETYEMFKGFCNVTELENWIAEHIWEKSLRKKVEEWVHQLIYNKL